MSGIACAGNWILDRIKCVDRYPLMGELANILSEEEGPGGSAFNVSGCFSRLQVSFPVIGFGCIGQDDVGRRIIDLCNRYGIEGARLIQIEDQMTSFTDVINVHNGGERTFFHARGANSCFAPHHVDISLLREKDIRIFHLGYLMLLDALDSPQVEYGTQGASLLAAVKEAGILTSLDLVTENVDKFKQVLFALPYTDYLIINEVESERLSGESLRTSEGKLIKEFLSIVGRKLLSLGVKRAVIIHSPEGVHWSSKEGQDLFCPSLRIPNNRFKGTTGAGDACCSGILLGLHEGWRIEETLLFANGCAAACITEPNTLDGLRPIAEIRRLCAEWRRDGESGR